MIFLLYYIFIISLALLALPFMCLISAIILATNGWPIIFVQKRVGINEKVFALYKFRTMVKDAEKRQTDLHMINEADGPVFKIFNDPRFTKVGKFLSHTGLDELPQLFNVLKGEMSLIGPRPLPVYEAAKLKPWQKKRHDIKPGIISPWVLNGYHTKKFDEWMKSDLEYIRKKFLAYDLYLAFLSGLFLLRLVFTETSKHLRTIIGADEKE